MSYKIYNRRNTQHRLNSVHTSGYMTLAVTRAGNIQISKAAVQYLGISAGDGVVLLEDEDFGDFYIGRGDVTHSALFLSGLIENRTGEGKEHACVPACLLCKW